MPVTNYFTVNGQIIGEETSGVRTDYLTDALGSVTATVDQSQNIINTYRWKPFGDLLSKTGTGTDPRFLWTGNTGSRTTSAVWAEQYNRARHYGKKQAQWTTVDPLWPGESAYGYVGQMPILLVDQMGTSPCPEPGCSPSVGVKKISEKCEVKKDPKSGGLFVKAYVCMKLSCRAIGSSVRDQCTFYQNVTDSLFVAGQKVDGLNDALDITFALPCPGFEWTYDAIGVHSGRKSGKDDCEKHIKPKLVPDTLPVKYIGRFRVECVCGRTSSKDSYSVSIHIYRKSGKILCDLG